MEPPGCPEPATVVILRIWLREMRAISVSLACHSLGSFSSLNPRHESNVRTDFLSDFISVSIIKRKCQISETDSRWQVLWRSIHQDFASNQLSPTPISTTTGTLSLTAFSMPSLTIGLRFSSSDLWTSKISSSCT